MRTLAALAGLTLVACATTPSPGDGVSAELRARCSGDVEADARCVEVLTGPREGYEAKAEVRDAEARREAGAFKDRLAKLRAAHEARSVRSSTVSVRVPLPEALAARAALKTRPPPPQDPDDDAKLDVMLSELTETPELETGSSVRAMTAAPAAPGEARVAPPPTRAAPATIVAPTPEALLRAGRCLLEADRAAFAKILAAMRGQARTRGTQGALALVMVDQDMLIGRVDAELAHRGLAKAGPVCASSAQRAPQGQLRAVLGPPPKTGADVARYGPGLERLEETLRVRAGLPRAR